MYSRSTKNDLPQRRKNICTGTLRFILAPEFVKQYATSWHTSHTLDVYHDRRARKTGNRAQSKLHTFYRHLKFFRQERRELRHIRALAAYRRPVSVPPVEQCS